MTRKSASKLLGIVRDFYTDEDLTNINIGKTFLLPGHRLYNAFREERKSPYRKQSLVEGVVALFPYLTIAGLLIYKIAT